MSTVLAWLPAQSVQVAIVFAVVWGLDRLVAPRASAGLRGALWAAFFVKLCVPPELASPISVARWLETDVVLLDLATSGARSGIAPWIAVVWALGAAASAAVAAWRLGATSRAWLRGARPAPERARGLAADLAAQVGIRRGPRVLVNDAVLGPATVGAFAPAIVLPGRFATDAAALEHVLLHELGHVRRRDGLRALAWTLVRCLYWFHPLVHVAARRAALVRELACDEIAARAARDGASGYRRTLLEIARPLLSPPPLLAPFGGSGAMIMTRLERLSRAPARARRFDLVPVGAFAVLCACCVPLGAGSPPAAANPDVNDVQGCLRKRYLVLAELARQESAGRVLPSE